MPSPAITARRRATRSRPACGRRPAPVLLAVIALLALTAPAQAGTVRAAVAANFTATARAIGTAFEAAGPHRVRFSFAATGTLYAQITQGAPFDVYLAADAERPRRAIAAGHAVPGSRFTYAVGRLALFRATDGPAPGAETLRRGDIRALAIANPRTAPYGAAALAALRGLGVHEALAPAIVTGNSVAQAFQFVATGSADLGIVALAQIRQYDGGAHWLIPANLHPRLAQDAVRLGPGRDSTAAGAFLAFLRGPTARGIIHRHGYEAGD